ncbi:hypothetical protein JCM1840_001969 [Sporobolomyces johnsonii]
MSSSLEHLASLFTKSSVSATSDMTTSHPNQFRAAQFTREGGRLEIKTVQWRDPREGEVVIRTHACGISSTDNITRHNLMRDVSFPCGPGNVVEGEIVACGKLGRHEGRLKQGMRVCAVLPYHGLQEYATVEADQCCEIKHKMDPLECLVAAFDGARVHASLRRFEREEKQMDENERRRRDEMNDRMGMKGEGVHCCYGEGGYARLALEILKNAGRSERIMLIAPNDRWSAKDYGIDERNMLVCGKHNLQDELRKRGGARCIIATDQPEQRGLDDMLNGMRYGADLVLLNPRKNARLELSLANIIAKHIGLRGCPLLSAHQIDECLAFCAEHRVANKIKCERFRFDEGGVNDAWAHMDEGRKFDKPVVVFQQQ